jgi:hypothetical protein
LIPGKTIGFFSLCNFFLGLKGCPVRKADSLTGICEPIAAQDTLLVLIFPDAYSFLSYVIWKSDQIQGSM